MAENNVTPVISAPVPMTPFKSFGTISNKIKGRLLA